MVHLQTHDGDRYSARVGYGLVDTEPDEDHWYEPTKASAVRLAKVMENILDSKKFWVTVVRPGELIILLQRPPWWPL